mgnify:CR=1 FL=1
MKTPKSTSRLGRLLLPLGVLVVFGLSIFSCSKNDNEVAPTNRQLTEEEQQDAVKELLRRMPSFQLQTQDGKTYRFEKTENGGFTFSNPPSQTGYNYVESTGSYTFVENSNGGTFVVAASGFGENSSSGGVIAAGNNSYNMDYTFCLTADDQALGFNLFGDDFPDGVSMVIGISGNLKKIMDNESGEFGEKDFEDLFNAFGIYVVYAKKASGSYPIVNWLEDMDQEESQLKNKGFAALVDFKNGKMFFSKEGKLSVSGGSINFSGKYLEISGSLFESDDDIENLKFKEVVGSGAMGCN